jgi:hypothetical protein
MKTIATVAILALSVFAGASAISSVPSTSLQTNTSWSSGPADMVVAQKYGRIDHSTLLSASILPESGNSGMSVAAY